MRVDEKIAVIGLGYVGLPVAVAFAKQFTTVIGYDVLQARVDALNAGIDWTGEVDPDELKQSSLQITGKVSDLDGCDFFVVTVPTPITANNEPDLGPLRLACAAIGPLLRHGAAVVFESTVYPGVTEDVCGPLLTASANIGRTEFQLGYSPERINPGDREHRLDNIVKIVAGDSEESLARIASVYGEIIDAGLHRAPSIKVAEAAKVLENTQRDVNIALMNELSIILDRMGVRTADVLAAAGTKWNFLHFTPGLVGGHCIGVDPYYLTFASQQHGYEPEVILAGRRINDSMGQRIAMRGLAMLKNRGIKPHDARVALLGLTFKEDVPDLRNSRSYDILHELAAHGVKVTVHDPIAADDNALPRLGHDRCETIEDLPPVDLMIIAVAHSSYISSKAALLAKLAPGAAVLDVKSLLSPNDLDPALGYWSL